jgi:predicted Mrr-cat superfamily restriction endonuclease
MLGKNKSAEFYGSIYKIDQIQKVDLVFLYHNENRIIAVGSVVIPYEGHDF